MKPHQLVESVRVEVQKPFSEKLKRAKQLVGMYANAPNVCVSYSGGKDSMAVLHLALQENPKIPVVFENTYIQWPETYKLIKKIAADWDLNLTILTPKPGVTFFTVNDRIKNERLKRDDGRKYSNLCCYWLKDQPFNAWRKQHHVSRSITGITAIESRHRMFTACAKGMDYYTSHFGYWKVNPITYWTPEEVWHFIHDNNLPVNEAYEKYQLERIGCMWCMSHKGWRKQVCRTNPKMYRFLMERYFGRPTLGKHGSYPT